MRPEPRGILHPSQGRHRTPRVALSVRHQQTASHHSLGERVHLGGDEEGRHVLDHDAAGSVLFTDRVREAADVGLWGGVVVS